ncbi:transmembrane domain-containing protein [Noumeavirus]|uniref:transmembrane domain-containing protein n=1 Tax=Noumeavirus TaxID=1955558 RepID=UPI000982F4BC|nr:transmembrane domain-containing protein [Noumeavirus]AQM73336.1 transmembrane domain-containing protein [Noumeavirus]
MQRQRNFFKDISVVGNVSVLPAVLAPGSLVYLTTDENLYISTGQEWIIAGGDVGPLASQVAQNTADIAALETDVSGLQTTVGTLQGQVATNTSDISTLQTETAALRVPRVISVLYATRSIPSDGFTDLQNLTTTAPPAFQILQGYTPSGNAQMTVNTTNGFYSSSAVGAVFRYTIDVIFSEAATAGEIRQVAAISTRGTNTSQGSTIAVAGVDDASQRVNAIFYTFVESVDPISGGYLVNFRAGAANSGATRTVTARIVVEQIQWG